MTAVDEECATRVRAFDYSATHARVLLRVHRRRRRRRIHCRRRRRRRRVRYCSQSVSQCSAVQSKSLNACMHDCFWIEKKTQGNNRLRMD